MLVVRGQCVCIGDERTYCLLRKRVIHRPGSVGCVQLEKRSLLAMDFLNQDLLQSQAINQGLDVASVKHHIHILNRENLCVACDEHEFWNAKEMMCEDKCCCGQAMNSSDRDLSSVHLQLLT